MPPTRLRPERRRPGDVVAAALVALVLVVGVVVLSRTSTAAGTIAEPAAVPVAAPPAATGIPAGFTEVWRAPSAATSRPVVAGPAVVTADGSVVVGRDAVSGTESWRYARDRPLCTVGAGFPTADSGVGRVLALFGGTTGYCSELTALRPDTGSRTAARNPDVRPGTRLVDGGAFVVATGEDYLEVLRSDLVKTLEYGTVTTPVQSDRQPRSGCSFGSIAVTAGRLGVVERCPEEPGDRLTVLTPDGADAEEPEEEFSVLLPAVGATLVALSAERAAVALPNPPRLHLLDRAGLLIESTALDIPVTDLLTDPAGGVVELSSGPGLIHWWTGSSTVALAAHDLTPLWTVPGALGPAQGYGGTVLVPVRTGLLVVDPTSGAVTAMLPVERAEPNAPVRLAAAGKVLLEQRGTEVVALLPR